MHADLRKASREQTAIGWDGIFAGYLSKSWGTAASRKLTKPAAVPDSDKGLQWTTGTISGLRRFYKAMWDHRNEVTHREDKQASARQLNEQISHHYDHRHRLLPVDQVLFSTTLKSVLETTKTTKRHTLRLLKRALQRAITTERYQQQSIRQYFTTNDENRIFQVH